jgi:PAS domain S-box-containing protein
MAEVPAVRTLPHLNDPDRNLLRAVIDSLFAFVGLLAPDGTVMEANRAALDAAAIDADDVLGRPFWEAHWWSWSGHEQRRLRDAVRRAAGGEPVRYDAQVRLAEGVRIWIDFQLVPLRDETGQVSRLVPSGIDITDRRRTEDTLSAIVEGAPLGFCQLDRNLRFVRVNDELAQMNGLPARDHIGRTPMTLLPDLPTDGYLPAFEAALEGTATEFEIAGATPAAPEDARYWLERVYPLKDREDRILGIGVFVLDITERRRVAMQRERDLRELQAALLPRGIPHIPGLDVATRYRSADEALEVGGDFYEVLGGAGFGCAALIGDVCGRGLAATALTALSRYTLVPLIEANPRSPAAALRELNRILIEHHEPSTRFVTIALAALQPTPAGFAGSVALAGHPQPILLRADGTTAEVGVHGSVLGVFDTAEVTDAPVALSPGDALVLYTDGYTEAHARDGGLFGEARMHQALAPCAGRPADEIAAALDRAVEAFTGARAERDDRALLVLAARPPGGA